MSEKPAMSDDHEMTLDPPGRIAVVGAGVLGLEAALYGRFLGYDVVVFEQGDVGQSLRDRLEEVLPVFPSGSLSSLAWAAIAAQSGPDAPGADRPLPMTVGQWISEGLERLAQTDLLRERVITGCRVTAIGLVDVDLAAASLGDEGVDSPESDEFEIVGDVPPDFRLVVDCDQDFQSLDFEAVILATGNANLAEIGGVAACEQSPYFFGIGTAAAGLAGEGDSGQSAESQLKAGYRQIVDLYAKLGGRATLDLYRPKRL